MAQARSWHGQNMPFSDTRVRAHSHRHTLVSFSEERLVTDHTAVEILSYCKAFLKGQKKGLIVVSVARMHADELLEKGIWQNGR